MSGESNQQHEGERGNTVDQVADLLMQEDAPEEESTEDQANFRFNDDDLIDDSEESEVASAQESDDVDYDETDDSNEPETDDDDGLQALANELGLEADKLTLSEDGEILINLKVNGKTEQVDLKEAISQTQFSKANDEKARNLADERKSFESERQQVAQEYAARLQHVQAMGQMLEQQLMAEYNTVDWDALKVSDPARYLVTQQEYQQRQQQLHQAGQQLGEQMRNMQEQQDGQWQAERAQILASERVAMVESVPAWSDTGVMQRDLAEIVQYGQSVGFSEDDLSNVIHNRELQVLRKAMLYDQGKTVADRKVKQAPRTQRASNGRFVKQKGGKVNKLIERAQKAKGANKRDAQADAVAALLMGES
jgi:hypothetical protein